MHMQKTVAEIANFIGGEVVGDSNLVITGLAGIKEAQQGDLTFVANSKYFPLIKTTKASAVITPLDLKIDGPSLIRIDNPSLAFTKIGSLIFNFDQKAFEGIHPTAIISPGAKIGHNVNIGPYAVIEKNVFIGDRTTIYSGCYVGASTSIGKDCLLYPNITLRERISLGDRVIVHSGTVIGSDGFGFVHSDGQHVKIPQLGTVVIQDDVEIGANVTIDRARFDKTLIGKGTKIDNLVQIAHNVRIGEHCIIISQVGISGSTIIEDNVTLAGQAGLAGHLTIGEGAIVASQAGVTHSVPPKTIVSGYPAKPHAQAKRVNACVQRLPKYIKLINELKQKIEKLEDEINKNNS